MKANKDPKLSRLLLGLALVAAWNPWSVGWLLSPDGLITSASKRGAVLGIGVT